MKYFSRFFLIVLVLSASACFGAYNAAKPADNEYVADVPALVRENFRAIKDDAIVNAGTVAGLSVGNASGNIPRSNGTLNTNLNSDLLDGYHASAFNASDALLLRLDGSRAMTGNLKFNGNYGILRATSDGADNGSAYFGGGGDAGVSRGAFQIWYGNEHASYPGQTAYYAGNVSTGHHIFYTGNYAERMRLTYGGNLLIGTTSDDGTNKLQVNGSQSLAGSLNLTADYGMRRNTSDESDTGSVRLGGGGEFHLNRGAVIGVYGNEYPSNGGAIDYYAGTVSATGNHKFYTNESERMRLTYGGNLLIGTTTDDGTNKLQVNGGIKGSSYIMAADGNTVYWGANAYIQGNNTSGLLTLKGAQVNVSGTLTRAGNTVWDSGNDGAGSGLDADTLDGNSSAYFLASSSYTAADVLTKIKTVDGSGSGLDADTLDSYHAASAGTANTIVLRDSYGGITGKSSGTGGMGVTGESAGQSAGVFGHGLPTTGYAYGVIGKSESAEGYDFYASGAGADYGTSSSIRWKKNRKPIANALGIVEKLEGLRFTWDKEHGGNPGIGFIAEEVGKYLPEIVVWDAKAPGYADGMDYSKMTPLLLQAIKELHAKVQRRTSDNAALLRKIEKQEREIDELKEEMRVMRSLFEAAVGGKADYDRMDGKHAGEYIQTNN